MVVGLQKVALLEAMKTPLTVRLDVIVGPYRVDMVYTSIPLQCVVFPVSKDVDATDRFDCMTTLLFTVTTPETLTVFKVVVLDTLKLELTVKLDAIVVFVFTVRDPWIVALLFALN